MINMTFGGQLSVRSPVYEYVWNNRMCQYICHISDDALNTTKIALFVDREGRPYELKYVVIPILYSVLL
mgnify:CR=1 FL=1